MDESKARVSITIDAELKRRLNAREDINVSGLVNDMLWEYMEGNGRRESAIEVDIARQRERVEEHEKVAQRELERLRELEEQAERLDESQLGEDDQLDVVLDRLTGTPADPTNEAVQTQARKADISPEKLAERMQKQRISET